MDENSRGHKNEVLLILEEEISSDLHNKGRQYIDHFSNLKIKYKKLALSWGGAYLFGLAYITIYEEQIFHISKFNLIGFMTIFVVIGIKLVQFLDVNLGHEQLREVFKYLMSFEKQNAFMIKPYLKIEKILYGKNFDPVLIDFLYYLSINFAISLLGVLALAIKMRAEFMLSMIVSASCIAIFLAWQFGTIFYIMRRRHKRTQD